MKYRVSDLTALLPAECAADEVQPGSAASTDNIKEVVMKKLEQETKKRHARRVRYAATAIAAALALTTGVVAAVRHLTVKPVAPDESVSYTDTAELADGTLTEREYTYDDAGAVVSTAPGQGTYDVVFRADYLPETEGVYHGTFDTALHDYETVYEIGTYDELLAQSGVTAEQAETYDTTLWCDGADGSFFRIDRFTGAQLDGTDLVVLGGATTEREGELYGFEATYLTVERDIGTYRVILLYDVADSCLINIQGTYDFDELEKIAGGLTLFRTNLPAVDTFDGTFSLFGVGSVG